MQSQPLSAVIAAILSHTPTYVWAILAALVLLGSLQLRRQRMSRGRLLVAPVAMGALSLWSVTAAFGAKPAVVAAWLIGMGLAWLANRSLRWPRDMRCRRSCRLPRRTRAARIAQT